MKWFLHICLVVLFIKFVYGEEDRIAAGHSIKEGEYPFFAQIKIAKHYDEKQYPVYYNCGATLIHAKWILSCADCFTVNYTTTVKVPPLTFERNLAQVMMGSVKKATKLKDSDFEVRYIKKAFLHSKYSPQEKHNIAIALLKEPFYFNQYIKTVQLASKKAKLCSRGIIVGTGVINDLSKFPDFVQFAYVNIINKKPDGTCFYSKAKFLKGHAYLGDSGGPLLCSGIQYGIISDFKVPGDDGIVTSVYESIAVNMGFIKQYIPIRPVNGMLRTKKEPPRDKEKIQKASSAIGIKLSGFLFIVFFLHNNFNEIEF